MCFSFKTSIFSYLLGVTSAIFCFCTRQIVLGMLILFFTQMQLSELIIWYGIDTNNENLNRAGTSFGKYLLPTHNFAIGLGILLVCIINKKPINVIPLIVGILFYIYVMLYFYNTESPQLTYPLDKTSCQNSKNRLQWPYNHSYYYYSFILSFIILVIYIYPVQQKIWFMSAFSIILFFSYLFVNSSTIGSVWCFSTAVMAPIISSIGYFLIKNEIDVMT